MHKLCGGATAERHNVRVILNPAPIRRISDETAKAVYAVTPNEHESQAIDIERFKNSIVTLGGDGCMINGMTKLPPLKVKPIDTTGAGDTFNGVFAVCIYSCVCAACVVTAVDKMSIAAKLANTVRFI